MLKRISSPFGKITSLLILHVLLGFVTIYPASASEKSPLDKLTIEQVYPNLSFEQSIFMTQTSAYPDRWYMIEKSGKLYWFDALNNNTSEKHLILDLQNAGIKFNPCNECGLLGITFAPEFPQNGLIYLSYTETESNPSTSENLRSVVARFNMTNQGKAIDFESKHEIFSTLQPYRNHNGGHIAFGPDGYLYFGIGDGGSGNDPLDHSQNKKSLLGSILRLTKEGEPAPGNLLAEQGGAAEIYAWGLRNPWRWSFDQQTHALWVADVGQNAQEEVNIVINGGNYGWRCEEGLKVTQNDCSTSGPYLPPITTYDRDDGVSITGGYVYRGKDIESIKGVYFFADFATGKVWGLSPSTNQQEESEYIRTLVQDTELNISSFAQGLDGEIYLLNYANAGGIYKLRNKTDI